MAVWVWAAVALGALLLAWALFVGVLAVAGRRADARALAGFVPDCVVLVGRLLRDPRVSRRRKLLLGLVVAYLALPFDLVPDFVPVAGQVDDAIVVALALRGIVRGGGAALVREHWPGPQSSLALVLRLTAPVRGSG